MSSPRSTLALRAAVEASEKRLARFVRLKRVLQLVPPTLLALTVFYTWPASGDGVARVPFRVLVAAFFFAAVPTVIVVAIVEARLEASHDARRDELQRLVKRDGADSR